MDKAYISQIENYMTHKKNDIVLYVLYVVF